MRRSRQTPPIFVTGFQRSGTTLLGNVIDRHPSVAVFIESFFIPRYYFTQVLFWPLTRDSNFLRLARAIVDEESARKNRMELNEERVLSSEERTLASLIDILFQDWARSRGKERWADKSPGYISKMPVLDRMFPDSRFVHIIRDGRDVWLSLKRMGWESSVVKVASDWNRTVSAARAFGSDIGEDRYLEVQYERLVTSPQDEARRITDFLGEPFDRAMIEPDEDGPGNPALAGWRKVDRAIDAGNAQKWKTRIDDDELAAFELCAGDLLESFGYEVSSREYSLSRRASTRLRQVGSRARRPIRLTRQAVRFFARAAAHRLS